MTFAAREILPGTGGGPRVSASAEGAVPAAQRLRPPLSTAGFAGGSPLPSSGGI
ncbi:hypothetical protein FHY05_002363 [Sphingomonas sp. BK580]|nr:hypothetical protein [Sphingomonas sp. BK580]